MAAETIDLGAVSKHHQITTCSTITTGPNYNDVIKSVEMDMTAAASASKNPANLPSVIRNKEGIELAKSAIHRQRPSPDESISDIGAFLHVVKGSLGTGLLAMGYAMKHAGLLTGTVCGLLIGLIITYTVIKLIDINHKLCAILNIPCMSYAETVEICALYGAHGWFTPRIARISRYVTDLLSFLTYFGLQSIYILVISNGLKQLDPNIELHHFIIIITLAMAVFAPFSSYKGLVLVSAFGNITYVTGVTLILYICLANLQPLENTPLTADVQGLPYFFSTTVLGMEGVGTILPVENKMKNPSHLLGFCGILSRGMAIVVMIMISVGDIGYLSYGQDVLPTLSLNLAQSEYGTAVKIIVLTSIILTYPLQMQVPSTVLLPYYERCVRRPNSKLTKFTMEVFLVLASGVLPLVYPDVASIMAIIGAVGFTMLGITIPSSMSVVMNMNQDGHHLPRKEIICDAILVVFGICLTVLGVYYAM